MVKLTSISTLILFAGVALAKCDDKELAAVKAEFYSNGIVPDVLPSFDPKALAYITFDYKNGSEPETILTPGTRIGRNGTVLTAFPDSQIAPTFSIVGLRKSTRQKYVGFVVDPDAPSRANPTRRNIRHMMATDLTLATASSYIKKGLALGSTVAPANEYRGPNPPIGSGPHRYDSAPSSSRRDSTDPFSVYIIDTSSSSTNNPPAELTSHG
ncbi:MAG: hypothetical protein L6R37_005068 [Teloschistes peruensis]|nr:MAG: hypothetical protein L6R37_005068 [Teloschistes peruensis]